MIDWRKSSHSHGDGGECVEVSTNTPTLLVRNSKDPDGPRLALQTNELAALIGQIKIGALNL